MRAFFLTILCVCLGTQTKAQKPSTLVTLTDFSSRAIDHHNGTLLFGANKARFGFYDIKTKQHQLFTIEGISDKTEFRAVTASSTGYFILSAGSPALLYKVERDGRYQEVYRDDAPKAFYNSMKQIDANTYIAIGDQIENCMAILISVDAGKSWDRTPCDELPSFTPTEGAFAASNTNIAITQETIHIATGVNSSRVITSRDKGTTWSTSETGIAHNSPTEGIYSLDFYNKDIGIAWGGDYSKPIDNLSVASLTLDGGKTWQVLYAALTVGYRSAVQFVPNSEGKKILAVGFNGIDYSSDQGRTWQHLSDSSYYALTFVDQHYAYLIGKNGLGLLEFDK